MAVVFYSGRMDARPPARMAQSDTIWYNHSLSLNGKPSRPGDLGMSFMPAQYVWLQPVLIGAAIVFIVDLIGNTITFSSRVASALVSAIVFAVIFGAIVYFGYGNLSMSVSTTPSASAPAATTPVK